MSQPEENERLRHVHTFAADPKCRGCDRRVGILLRESYEAGRAEGVRQAEERTHRLGILLRDYEYKSKNGYPATSPQSIADQLHFVLTGEYRE